MLLGFISAAAFCLAAITFAATLFGLDAVRVVPELSWLHAATMVLGTAIVISIGRYYARHSGFRTGNVFEEIFADCPRWTVTFQILLVVITFLCAGAMILGGEGGQVGIIDGQYVLQSKGKLIRPLSVEEYDAQVLRQHLVFAAVWMTSLFVNVSWFLLRQSHPLQDA